MIFQPAEFGATPITSFGYVSPGGKPSLLGWDASQHASNHVAAFGWSHTFHEPPVPPSLSANDRNDEGTQRTNVH